MAARPLVLHVKTALKEDDAQICVAPNLAWAALAEGRAVTIVFDASAVQSITKGYGWHGWIGEDKAAMDRASIPARERKALAEEFGVPEDEVPSDYGQYLGFLKQRGARLYYNKTMTTLYQIEKGQIHPDVTPLGIKELLKVLAPGEADYIVY